MKHFFSFQKNNLNEKIASLELLFFDITETIMFDNLNQRIRTLRCKQNKSLFK